MKFFLIPVLLLSFVAGDSLAQSAVPRHAATAHAPVIRRISPAAQAHVLSKPVTTIKGKELEIATTIDLGQPKLEVSSKSVTNAPAGMTFSTITWPRVTSVGLPGGAVLLDAQKSDRESIPGISLTFAVPASATDFHLTISDAQWQRTDARFLPAPAASGDSSVVRFTADYAQSSGISWSKPRTFRSLRSVSVWVPLLPTSGARALLTKAKLTVHCRFSGELTTQPVTDPIFAGLNHSLALNTDDLARFSVPLRPASLSVRKGSGQIQSVSGDYAPIDTESYKWIDPSATYVKLTVTRDGLYRITPSEIAARAAGFDVTAAGWRADNLRVIHLGREIPVYVEANLTGEIAAVTFYGERRRGLHAEYYDNSTDSSAYFLTIAGSGPVRRYRPSTHTATGATDVTTGDIVLHHERDLAYYPGDKVANEIETTNRTETVSGERFYWFAFHGPSSNDSSRLTDTFYVAGLPGERIGKSAQFHFFLRGMSVDPQFPNDPTHHVRIRLNGEEIAERFFNEYDSIAVEPVVPLTKLRVGANKIEIISAGTRATIDQFYLDYYDVRFEGAIAPSSDTSITRGQYDWTSSVAGGLTHFSSLPGDAIAFNLSDTTLLVAPFVDSTNGTSHYVASRPSEMLEPDGVLKVTNWTVLDARNAADYIVLTHPDFRHAADLLKIRRASAGLRSMVVEVQDVYNAFGYGSDDPESIRRYLSYVYYKYAGTPVSMVTLMGDGTLDPKLNENNELAAPNDRSNQRNFIPTYGNPVSDFYYTLSDAGNLDTLQPKMLIARIPVSKSEEADAYVTKLVEYETQAPAEWNHNFLFVPGGDPGFQHRSFVDEAHYYLAPDGVGLVLLPTNVRGSLIERTDFSGNVDVTHIPEIQSAVRQGQAIFYFTGHGATFITDVQLGDPGLWRNKQLYPVLITLSCRTGAFAEPNQVSLNEAFLRASEGGVIMALGTTGFGEVTYDNMMSTRLFQLVRSYPQWHDTTKATTMNLTQLFTAAKLFAADSGGLGTVGLNARLQYSVLGDAALGFVLRPQPEFVERPADIRVLDRDGRPSTTVHITDTTMRVDAVVHNVGFSADRPVVVRIRDAAPKGAPFDVFDTLSRLDTTATVSATFFFGKDGAGEHTISVKIDPLDQFAETHEEDNEATTHVLVSGISVSALFPYEGSVGVCDITATSAHVVLIVPRTDAGLLQGRIELELDTTNTFSGVWHGQVNINNSQYVEFDLPLTSVPQPSTHVYWWRARLVPSVGEPTDWQTASFLAEPATPAGFAYRSREQLQSTIVAGLQVSDQGALYLPQHDSVVFDVISLGSEDPWTLGIPRSSITINNRPIYEFGNVGYVLAELTADGSALDTVYEILHSDDSAEQAIAAERFVSIVNGIPDGRRVILLTNWQPFMYYFNLSPRVQTAIESLGGTLGFKGVGYFESYALIGAKGMAPGTAREKRSEAGKGPTELLDTIVTLGTSGIAEFPSTAAATKYVELSWEGPPIPTGTDIRFTITGRKRGSSVDEVVATFAASSARTFDLRSIDAKLYDRIQLTARFERGSSAVETPQLTGVRITYDAAPELAFEEDTLRVLPGIVVEGQQTVASYTVRALTCTAADHIPIALLRSNKGVVDTIRHEIAHLDGHASIALRDTFRTEGEQGLATVTARINPNLDYAEQLTFNDQITGSYFVGRDTTKPVSEILVDDRHLPPYGYASNEPWITVNMVSTSAIPQTDSLAISARFLREDSASSFVTISTATPGDFRVEYSPATSGGAHASLRFQPLHPLAPGKYQIAAYSHDASGNVADTIYQTFTVTAENGLERVMNYPNPFKMETDFTYVLRNSGKADVKIVIYTVAGHKIRTLKPASTHAGMNALHWDGRDEEGNLLANGTYLYRVVLTSEDEKGGSSTQALTEKAVVSR